MKQTLILILVASSAAQAGAPSDCLISVEPQWKNIENNCKRADQCGGKWILVGSITFRKKSKEQTKLEHMKLSWHGKQINHLYGSLYKKLPEKRFMPIELNLICDSSWNKARQELILNFEDNKQTLGPLNIFYLVLTVPTEIEPTLRQGHFSMSKPDLPLSFRSQAAPLKLDFAHLSRVKDRNISAHAS